MSEKCVWCGTPLKIKKRGRKTIVYCPNPKCQDSIDIIFEE